MTNKPIDVVAAVRMISDDSYWVCRRNASGKHAGLAGMWEFPGGKVEPGESPEEALMREMKEEFDVSCYIAEMLDEITTVSEGATYRVMFFRTVFTSEPKLIVHSEAKWVSLNEAKKQQHLPSGTEFIKRMAKTHRKGKRVKKITEMETQMFHAKEARDMYLAQVVQLKCEKSRLREKLHNLAIQTAKDAGYWRGQSTKKGHSFETNNVAMASAAIFEDMARKIEELAKLYG
jgi:8-oxo-dGTP diphosphatase